MEYYACVCACACVRVFVSAGEAGTGAWAAQPVSVRELIDKNKKNKKKTKQSNTEKRARKKHKAYGAIKHAATIKKRRYKQMFNCLCVQQPQHQLQVCACLYVQVSSETIGQSFTMFIWHGH